MSFERSMQLHSTQQHTPFRNRRAKHLLNRDRDDTLNLSPILNETSIFRNLNDTSLRQVLDESSILVTGGTVGEGLNDAFFEIIQSSRASDVLDTLARLSQVCCDTLELIEPWNRYSSHNYWLAEEANTWKLLHCLYADSINEHPKSIDQIITKVTLSQQTLVGALFRCDSEVRLLQLLVDWLEATASFQEAATKTTAPVLGNNIHWGNTLHQLLIGSSLFNKEKNKSMVTCMDPDAVTRQKKTIHSDDQQDDNDLCKRVFTEIRCGKFNDAISLCLSAGQPWRAASLQGWRLLHYLEREDENMPLQISGNPNRDLWKWCSLGVANNVAENVHYRATLGVLCGHLESTLQVCHGNWEDLLWAHLRVQIEARVDKFLREHYLTAQANTTTPEILELLQSELEIEELSLQEVFAAVNALMEGKKETFYQKCQKYLMLGHIRAILQGSLIWIDEADDRFIRFLTHLVLVLRQMGKDPHHDIGDKVIEKHIHNLVTKLTDGTVDTPELIAYYTSNVPSRDQVYIYAELMDRIHKSESRQGVVKAGNSAGIDVAASARLSIKKAITEIQQGYGNIDMTITQAGAVDKDKSLVNKVIASLEWMALLPNQYEEGLWLSNAMIRTFITIGNTDAASMCVSSLNKMFPSLLSKVSPNSSELREHLCLKAYLESLDGFATWYRHYISGQPKEVEPLAADATFTDKVHHEQRLAQVEQQKSRWLSAVTHQSKHTKGLLYNVLLFPGGWLQESSDSTTSDSFSEDEKEERLKQLETLRRLCIPEVVILILKILQSNEDVESHKEVLQLSVLIAAENRALYKVFTKDKIIEVLDRIKESSFLLLENGMDIFGFETGDDD